ncbi:MoxR family ATPase [Bacillus sp. ISL-47]|uniref:AAA family ATPase n=1 Tax=Bacillus sp. ISL-47 TaxID=2819130 RepID=UPI001BE736F2|nr:MoxR family ATPase [Bacillus sp. ISL-47]MBT2687803.1 MoxR family ATPase [Bacillus sp. ISL-47]
MEYLDKLKKEINKVIAGKEQQAELLAISLLFNGHILLESVPGTGKTMLAKSFAQSINGKFSRIQFTPDVLPSDVTGIQFFNPKKQEFEFHQGPIVANIVLADEINRATPRTQSSLLEVMEERQVTIDGHTISLSTPFMVIATQNPFESQQGTFPLPVAQLDRFFMKLAIDYPSLAEERTMLKMYKTGTASVKVNAVLTADEIDKLKETAGKVGMNEPVESYLLELVRKTREHADIELGVSPRGTLALMKASQGKAFLEGRNYVVPNDIKFMVPYVLGHRIFLSTEASMTKTPESVLQDVLESVPVPVESGAF